MSRVGSLPVEVPEGVKVNITSDSISVEGKRGKQDFHLVPEVSIKVEDGKIVVTPANMAKKSRMMWGTYRSIIQNMVTGVTEGFKVELDIQGVGYRASLQGKNLVLQLGFSHDVIYPIPDDVTIAVPKQTTVILESTNKQRVGQIAAEIRSYRPPEPYKGKGVRYVDEYVRRKEGKKK